MVRNNKPLKVIGTPTPKIDAGLRASGQAVYGHDIKLPGMLYGAILRAEHPCALVESIDVFKARALPGVACVITADDVDTNPIGYRRDHPILKKGEVGCIRDELAAVAAISEDIAREALTLIQVKYKPKKGIFDPHDALSAGAPVINKYLADAKHGQNVSDAFVYEHGDLDEERKKSVCVVTRKYALPRVTHCCLATSNITASYSPSYSSPDSPIAKRLTLYSSTQVPFLYQRDMAHALKMNPSDIRIIQPFIGGGFGSKLDMYPFEPIAALLSMKTGKPVQLIYDRKEEFLASPTRQAMVIELTTGADKDGKFTFRDVNIIKDNGAYTSWGATTPFVMMQTFSSLYRVGACRFVSKAVYTNNPYAGSFRGYGNPQATFALESSIDLMAEELGMDKAGIRLRNANYPGETTGQGLNFGTCGHAQALDKVVSAVGAGPMENGGRFKRGIGFASMLHVGGGAKIYRSDGCGTTLKIDDYGYVTVISGSSEIGQGSETVLAMIASEEFAVPLYKIKVINTDTDVKPWDVGVHASRTSFVAGNSLLGAIARIKAKLNRKAAEMLQTGPENLEYGAEQIRRMDNGASVRIEKVVRELHFQNPNELCVETYFYEPSSRFQDKGFKGDVSGSYAFAAQSVEVEVDTFTGNVRVLNVHVAQDVGKVLNPLLIKGQIDGGVVMGVGYALSEELIVEEGRVLNPDFHEYKLPTVADVPEIHFYPIETNDPQGPYGAKGMAEAPLIPTAAAIANAVAAAIGVRIYSLPMTPEKVLRAIKSRAGVSGAVSSAVSSSGSSGARSVEKP